MKHMTAVSRQEVLHYLDLLTKHEIEKINERGTLQERISLLDATVKTIVDSMREYNEHDARLLPGTKTSFSTAQVVPRWGILGWFGWNKTVPAKKTKHVIPATQESIRRDIKTQLERLLTLGKYKAGKIHVSIESIHWSRAYFQAPSPVRTCRISFCVFNGEFSITTYFTRSDKHNALIHKEELLSTHLDEVRKLREQLELDKVAGGDVYMSVADYAKLKALK